MSDLEIIKQIEKELGVKLEQKHNLSWSKGYILNEKGYVIGLDLCDCDIDNLDHIVFYIKKLKSLIGLSLNNNKIKDISALSKLINLVELYLAENKVRDISPLSTLTNLTKLGLGDNIIKDISFLSELKNLTELYLWKNEIMDISSLKNLNNLCVLSVADNSIKVLPAWITEFNMEIKWEEEGTDIGVIDIHNNPLQTPPLEIIKQGDISIRNYFDQLKVQKEDYTFEAKLLIIGEAGAGKTTMAKKIEDANCDLPERDATTKGIDVKRYYFSLNKEDIKAFNQLKKLKNKKIRLNIWDFGGQEIYKATHRFFLSKRSLYVLVADSRNEDTNFNYWLHIVEMFGGDSPLLIVLNEKNQRKRNLDTSAMRNRFANISEVLDVDFAEDDKTRLNRLERAVRYHVSQLPHIGSPVPSKWMKIRKVLDGDKRNAISLENYREVCQDNGISKRDDALILSRYFHDIGVFLHFQDDALLRNIIFLKPSWVTNTVYKVLDHPLLNKQNGRFSREDAKKIWNEDEDSSRHPELLRLMQKFFLTYEIENSGEYIVPERLPSVKPDDYFWDEMDNLFFRYKYDYFMPYGIMSQFIVQMHRYIRNHNHVWRRGVILERDNTSAEIVESYDSRVISIRISGKNRRDFMIVITEYLDKINDQYKKMKVEKLIPCNCDECKKSQSPYFHKLEVLKKCREKETTSIQCHNSFDMVNVRSLIDGVINSPYKTWEIKRDTVFISYSKEDKLMFDKVQTHLKVLKNLGININIWDDTKIKSGDERLIEIEKALSSAKVVILLVSNPFLASDFINKKEIPPLLDAAQNDGAKILSLILEPCLFKRFEKLSKFQAVNKPSEPLSKLSPSEQDEILLSLSERIMELMGN